MITSFRNSYYFLSNFFLTKVHIDGMTFPSSEHAYMSYKSDDQNWKSQCMDPHITPSEIKKRSLLIPMNSKEWDGRKKFVMKRVLKAKFQDPTLAQWLLDTGNRELIEGNTWGDKYWGVDIHTGEGQNVLGKLLMEVRAELLAAMNQPPRGQLN